MDDSKVFMFPDGGTRQTSNDVNSLLPLLMCNGGFGGGNWIWIIFLFFLYPLMRNGGLFGNTGANGTCLGPLANKELNPQFAKDKARDERIAGIENEVAGMKGDIAKILAAVTKN